jgi:aspartate/methionine/tyrosine aminotransferase
MTANRKILRHHLEPLLSDGVLSGEIPEHGCVYFPEVVGADDTNELVDSLAKDHNVFVVPGRFFGCPGHIRIGFGAEPTNLENALAAFVKAMTR